MRSATALEAGAGQSKEELPSRSAGEAAALRLGLSCAMQATAAHSTAVRMQARL